MTTPKNEEPQDSLPQHTAAPKNEEPQDSLPQHTAAPKNEEPQDSLPQHTAAPKNEEPQDSLPPHIEKAMEDIMGPFMPMLAGVFNMMNNEKDLMLNSPRTYMAKIEENLNSAEQQIEFKTDAETIVRSLSMLMHHTLLNLPKRLRETAQTQARFLAEFSDTTEYLSIEKLANAAEARAPKKFDGAFLPITQSETDKNLLLAGSLLHQASRLNGESRAEQAIRAAKRVSESLYQPYVRTLHRLFRLSKGIDNVHNMEYGSVYRALIDADFSSQFPSLLETDAVLIRNSEAHEKWNYHVRADEIEVHDRKNPTKRIPVLELLNKAEAMLFMAGVLLPKYIQMRQFLRLANALD